MQLLGGVRKRRRRWEGGGEQDFDTTPTNTNPSPPSYSSYPFYLSTATTTTTTTTTMIIPSATPPTLFSDSPSSRHASSSPPTTTEVGFCPSSSPFSSSSSLTPTSTPTSPSMSLRQRRKNPTTKRKTCHTTTTSITPTTTSTTDNSNHTTSTTSSSEASNSIYNTNFTINNNNNNQRYTDTKAISKNGSSTSNPSNKMPSLTNPSNISTTTPKPCTTTTNLSTTTTPYRKRATTPSPTPALTLLTLLLWTMALTAKGEQRFANQPSPQTAVKGMTVVLPCRIINKVGTLQWTRDDFGLGNERELYDYKRYTMIGSDEEGDFSLRISPVELEDDAYFQCQVTGYKDIPGVRSQTAKLTVYVSPASPEIIQGPVVTSTAGAGVQLTCVSRGGKPAAEIQWLDGSERAVTEGIDYTTELMKDGQRQNAKSTLSFVATRHHHNAVFTCTATNPAQHQPLRTQVRLQVSYPPEVTITHDQDGYREGQTATLTCSATANPSTLTYRWYRNGEVVSGNNGTQLVVKGVTRDSNLEDVTCEVSNKVGSSRKITRLSIHYGPSFSVPPVDQYAEVGQNVTLTCQVDSNPDPTIVWINQQTQTVAGTGPELRVRVTKATVGAYQCIAKVEGFPEISETVGVFLKGPPEVRSERVQWGREGDTVLVECLVTSASPRSVTVAWTHRGALVDLDNRRFEVTEDVTSRGLRHTLVIHSARDTDFGTYNCSVQNAYGSDVFEILLNKKKTLPVLVILYGVTGGIVLVLVAALVVILCAKRTAARHKASKSGLPEKTVALQITDQNSTANESDLKVELDQRTGSSLSNKDGGELDGGWGTVGEKDGVVGGLVGAEHSATSTTYLTSTNSYLYNDAFSPMPPLKINGHLSNNGGGGGGLSYGNYADHSTLTTTTTNSPSATNQQQQQQQKQSSPPHAPTSPTGGYIMGGGGSGGSMGGGYTHTPSGQQHPSMYPNYGDFDGSRDASSATNAYNTHHQGYNNGYANHNYNKTTSSSSSSSSTLPLSLHVTSRGNGGSGVGVGVGVGGVQNAASTIPRLGIPVDPSQYIVPPRTQVMQGALATHV